MRSVPNDNPRAGEGQRSTIASRSVRAPTTRRDRLEADDVAPGRAESLVDIIEWLFVVFESRLGLTAIVSCVHECCRELGVDADTATMTSLEQRANRRLTELADLSGPGTLAGRLQPVDRSTGCVEQVPCTCPSFDPCVPFLGVGVMPATGQRSVRA